MPRSVTHSAFLAFGLVVFGLLHVLPAQDSRPARRIEAELRSRLAEPVAELDLDLIMLGDEFSGSAPTRPQWEGDGRRAHFSWKKGSIESREWTFDVATNSIRRREAADSERGPLAEELIWNSDNTLALWNSGGDVKLWTRDGTSAKLLFTREIEKAHGFSLETSEWVYERERALYARSLKDGAERQLLKIVSTPTPLGSRDLTVPQDKTPETRPAANADELRLNEERELLRVVDERAQRRESAARRLENVANQTFVPATFGPPEGVQVVSLHPSMTLDAIAIVGRRPGKDVRTTIMPDYVTKDGYVGTESTRSKVGAAQDTEFLYLVDPYTHEAREVLFPLGLRDVQIGPVLWSPFGGYCVVVLHANDNKDEWIAVVQPGFAEARVVFNVSDPAWVYNFAQRIGFIPGTPLLWFLCERSGFVHLHRLDLERGTHEQLTSGSFEVIDASYHPVLEKFVLTTTRMSPHERQVELLEKDGSSFERLTFERGNYDVAISPDGENMLYVYSFANRPQELYFRRLRDKGSLGTRLTYSPSPAFDSVQWPVPEIVEIPARDGARVPARLYRPENPRSNRPAVIFVHGAGYLQNVHWWWSRYTREYMFHHFLTRHGYHVLDLDFRGSAGYGREWRTAIYRHMGGKDLSDHVDAAKFLVETYHVSPERIGIYGGSYGGFITLMAMFLHPETFAAGAALRPVTDWAHYNHGYTSNILNQPHLDIEAYRRSSPIYFAEGLKGHLLICHGMVDDNVHFQDSVRLVQRLIELRKENWELAIYPVENHAFQDAASWADEYKRIWKLFDRVLGQP